MSTLRQNDLASQKKIGELLRNIKVSASNIDLNFVKDL